MALLILAAIGCTLAVGFVRWHRSSRRRLRQREDSVARATEAGDQLRVRMGLNKGATAGERAERLRARLRLNQSDEQILHR
jgi:hypothetical protein